MALTKRTRDNAAAVVTTSEAGNVQADLDNINKKLYYITPEMFGAVGDGVTDDLSAIQEAILFLRNNPAKYSLVGYGDYAVSSSISVSGFGSGCKIYLRSVRAHNDFPAPADWKTATPILLVGETGGSQVGLDISFDFLQGLDKATYLQTTNNGCGGSHFHVGRLNGVVNGVAPRGVTWPNASNRVTGDYWYGGSGQGIRLQRGTSGTSPIVEGWIFDVNFTTGFSRGGVHLMGGSQYADIRGQVDFNGRFLSELTMASSTVNLVRGDTITDGDNSAEIIDFYEAPLGTFKVLISENQDVSEGSKFSTGATLTSGAWSSTINSIKLSAVDNWYPDIIHGFTGDPFGRVSINSTYCGGLVGGSLYSSNFWFGNSGTAFNNGVNGAQWVHSGTVLSLRDVARENYVFDFAEKYMAPYRHLYMRNYRLYGQEVGVSFTVGTPRTIRSFTRQGDETVSNTAEIYRITVKSSTNGVHGECLLYVEPNGALTLVNNTINYPTLSIAGTDLVGAQGAQGSMFVVFNFQRI